MNERGRSLLCIDMADTMQTVKKTNRLAFCNARHFLSVFRRVYGLHPCRTSGAALQGPAEALQAMTIVYCSHPDVIGVLAGDGPLQPHLEALVADAGLTERIRFVGHISQAQLSRILPHCVTLSPLTGMALVECGLGGSPAVAYDADWQPEFVDDGVNGFIVPLHDWKAMGTRVAELLGNHALRNWMSQAMRASAMARADRKALARSGAEVFGRLLGEKA